MGWFIDIVKDPIGAAFDSIKNYFDEDEDEKVTLSEVGHGLSKVGKAVGGFAADVARAPVRTLTSVGIEPAAAVTSLATGKQIDPVFTPETRFQKAIYGEEPIQGIFNQVDVAQNTSENLGSMAGLNEGQSKSAALVTAPLFVAGMASLDLLPMGGGAKNIAKESAAIAATKDVGQIVRRLSGLVKGSDEAIESLARSFVNVTDKKLIEETIKNEMKIGAEAAAKAVDPLAEDAARFSKATEEVKPITSTAKQIAVKADPEDMIAKQIPITQTAKELTEEVATKGGKAIPESPVIKSGDEILDEIGKKIKYEYEVPKTPIKERLGKRVAGFREKTINYAHKLDLMQARILKNAGQKRTGTLVSEAAEIMAGAGGKIEAQQRRFAQEVLEPLGRSDEMYEAMNQYMFARRTIARTETGKAAAKVAEFTREDMIKAMKSLETKIGPEAFQVIEKSAAKMQTYAKNALDEWVEVGLLTPETAKRINESSDFYAKFKVVQGLGEEIDNAIKGGRGIKVSEKDVLQKLKGIEDSEFKVFDLVASFREHLAKMTASAEKQKVMNVITDLAEIDKKGVLFRKLGVEGKKSTDLAKKKATSEGFTVISAMRNGEKIFYGVENDIANVINGLNVSQATMMTKIMGKAMTPFRFGTISANAAFQIGNLLFADIPRNFIMNKYVGFSPQAFVRFAGDYIHGFYSAVSMNIPGLNPSKLAMEYLESGAAGSTIARTIRPEAFFRAESAKGISKARRLFQKPGDALAHIGDIVESTSKMAAYKPGKRAMVKGKATLEDVVLEVRRYGGSPDFARRGAWGKDMNVLFMFFNARLQGVASDLRRLQPFKKGDNAMNVALKGESLKAWGKLTAAVGVPTTLLMMHNLREENREDFEKVPQWERDNYFMIPKSILYGPNDPRSYITTQDGEVLRDYWKIQKRESVKLYSNVLEDAIKFWADKDVAGFKDTIAEILEGTSPINIEGKNLTERGLSVVSSLNPILKVPAELVFGKNTFTKKEMIPTYINGVSSKDLMMSHPEQVYTSSTPQAYIDMAYAMKQVGGTTTSPILLDSFFSGMTGGLTSYFTPRRGKTGERETISRIGGRFNRSTYTEQTSAEQETQALINQARSDYALGKFQVNEMAQITLDAIKQANTVEERTAILQGIDSDTVEQMVKIIEKDALGLNYTDIQIKNLPSNEAKAKFILLSIRTSSSPEETATFITKMKDLGIMTDGVVEKMRGLIESRAI